MQHIPTAISVAALIVAFVAVSLMRRAPELPKDKEKKARKKRQAREDQPQQV
jgi:heme exporter protein D